MAFLSASAPVKGSATCSPFYFLLYESSHSSTYSLVSTCSVQVRGNDDMAKEVAFRLCKTHLSRSLQQKCGATTVNDTGHLLYCSNRGGQSSSITSPGIITCCFDQYSCVSDWLVMQNTIYKKAKEFLQGPKDFIRNQLLPMGYKTCHILNSSLDATPCAEDCDRLKNQRCCSFGVIRCGYQVCPRV